MSKYLSDLKHQVESDSLWESQPRLGTEGVSRNDMQRPHLVQESGPSISSTTPANGNSPSAATNVLQQGVTYSITGPGASVNLQYGASIGQQNTNAHVELLQNMKRSRNAEYDMVEAVVRGPCTPQTRTTVLETLVKWSKSKAAPLYWLTGIAGTGKTTITYSFCDMMKAKGRLAATFFCSRSVDDCRDIKLIIPTLAYQLAREHPLLKCPLVKILEDDPDIFQRRLEVQLQKLVINLWNAHADDLPANVVVVLDALDECDGGHASFLKVIFDHAAQLPFKILIASRPEFSVRDTMKSKDGNTLSTFILHEVEGDIVQGDIARYLDVILAARVPPDVLDTLKRISGSLFIVAATLVRLFTDANIDPRERLEHFKTSWASERTDQESLDDFYRGVLTSILQDRKLLDKEVDGIRNVLFTVVCARDPLTQEGLAALLGVKVEEAVRRLDSLHSILSIPQGGKHPITVLHASIADFIQDPKRSQQFCCYPQFFNSKMAKWCLNLMNSQLRQNPCRLSVLEQSSLIDFDIPSSQKISPGVYYAVVYWGEHLSLSDLSEIENAMDLLYSFVTSKLLHWLEHLVLLRKPAISILILESVLGRLEDMRGVNKVQSRRPGMRQRIVALLRGQARGQARNTPVLVEDEPENPEIESLVYDALRFVQQFYELIKDRPMQIYFYACIWIPEQSSLRHHYSSKAVPRALYGLDDNWTGADRLIDTRPAIETSPIVISPDGSKVMYVSSDNTIRIWSMRDQIEESILAGHTSTVQSVVISPDGRRVVSASGDQTIRIWDVVNSQILFTLKTPQIDAVAISSDHKYIASTYRSGSIHIGDRNGNLIRSLDGALYTTCPISFMPNTTLIVSKSHSTTARIWNARTGEIKATLRGHTDTVRCVACSPVGSFIVTGSEDKTARIWDVSGKTLRILRGHSHLINGVAFMPDGKRVVTGSDDRTLRIWDVGTGVTVQVFAAAQEVKSVAVFPDGIKIASLSSGAISIWSMRGGTRTVKRTEKEANEEHKEEQKVFSSSGQMVLLLSSLRILDTVTLEAKAVIPSRGRIFEVGTFSRSGRKVALAGAKDKVITVWEVKENVVESRHTFQGHKMAISYISFSSDEQQLVSSAYDGTARVWSMKTGQQIHVLELPEARFAEFSQDGSRVIAATVHDPALHVWNAQTGNRLHSFGLSSRQIAHTLFTPDDQHFIIPFSDILTVWNSQSYKQVYQYRGYKHWRIFDDGSSYVLTEDSQWICRIARLGDKPCKTLWIPPPVSSRCELLRTIIYIFSTRYSYLPTKKRSLC